MERSVSVKLNIRAQSILEYVIIMSVVALAVVAMQVYFKRAVNARLEEIKQEYTPKATTG
jgi:Flp pilus assembly pilin Flp